MALRYSGTFSCSFLGDGTVIQIGSRAPRRWLTPILKAGISVIVQINSFPQEDREEFIADRAASAGWPADPIGSFLAQSDLRGGARTNSDRRGDDLWQTCTETKRMSRSELSVSLSRSVALLAADIESEETRTRIRDLTDPAYSTLAWSLRARRDNLQATIDLLESSVEECRRPHSGHVFKSKMSALAL